MKVWVYTIEHWPTLLLTRVDGVRHLGAIHEVPDDLVARYFAAEAAWRAVQDEVEAVTEL